MVLNNIYTGKGEESSSSGGCSSGGCGNGLEKVYPTAAVRYGYMKNVGDFSYPERGMVFGCGADVIVQSPRGIEMGEMVSLTCDGCDKCVSRDQIRAYVKASGPDYYSFGAGKILRLASDDDIAEWGHIRAETLRKKKFCQERADELNLPLRVRECEHLFGGERAIFYFMAEGRVDFRALVRELADEFQTRIEMRQVGARDEARLLADYETCGRECCCKNFLKTLKPVSMKMAKMQKATLDPAKVSGRCGRLKCCLRYEHVTYEELDTKLPRVGTKVYTEGGRGTVVARQILTQLLQIETTDGGRLSVAVEDLLDEEQAQRLEAEKAARAEQQRQEAAELQRSRARRGRQRDGRPQGRTTTKPKPGQPQARSQPKARVQPKDQPKRQSADRVPGNQPEKRTDSGNAAAKPSANDDQPRRKRRGRRGRGGQKRRGGNNAGGNNAGGDNAAGNNTGRNNAGGNSKENGK